MNSDLINKMQQGNQWRHKRNFEIKMKLFV